MEKLSKNELLQKCAEKGISVAKSKTKNEIAKLLLTEESVNPVEELLQFQRLNYIGSKFQLLGWLENIMLQKTGWTSFSDKRIADLFSGTGIVGFHFRQRGAHVISNDSELYSSIISHAFTRSTFTNTCKTVIDNVNTLIMENTFEGDVAAGYITRNYSPYGENERKFFTVENAIKIDFVRKHIENMKNEISHDEYMFLMASLLVSADAISNVPAVYGCYLKAFKTKAVKPFHLIPVHNLTAESHPSAVTHNRNVLDDEFLESFECDAVYLDPPYNERQYSKNYFPLNMIAKSQSELETFPPLKGKTGIPVDCFISPFCKKGAVVENAFDHLCSNLKTKWLFLSYNSESIVSKEKMIEILSKYGNVTVEEREYKRFKSFEYNEDLEIKEYLFCLEKM